MRVLLIGCCVMFGCGQRSVVQVPDPPRTVEGGGGGPEVTPEVKLPLTPKKKSSTKPDTSGQMRTATIGELRGIVARMLGRSPDEVAKKVTAGSSPSRFKVFLADAKIEDEDLIHLSGIANIESLSLSNCRFVEGPGLAHLAGMAALSALNLYRTGVGDESLVHLSPLTGLVQLKLHGTKVTDAGLESLHHLPNLGEIWLSDTGVTAAGLDSLEKSRPGIRIFHPLRAARRGLGR